MLLHIAVLDVGHADCCVVWDEARTSTLVIDCGHAPTLMSYLAQHSIGRVTLAVASHNDADHIRGLVPLVHNIPVERLTINPALRDAHGDLQQLVWGMCEPFEGRQHLFSYATTTDSNLKSALQLLSFRAEILHPNPYQSSVLSARNPSSTVIRVECNGSACLFPGDLTWRGWQALLCQPSMASRLRADVLKFPHHGGRLNAGTDRAAAGLTPEGITERVLNAVSPRFTLISTADRSGWSHPDAEVMAALRAFGREREHRIACTEVTRLCDPQFPLRRPAALALLPSAHHSARVCSGVGVPCAGNILLDLEPGGKLNMRSEKEHQEVVQLYAQAQCLP